MIKLKCGLALGVAWCVSMLTVANAQTKLTTVPPPGPAPAAAAPAAPAPAAAPPATTATTTPVAAETAAPAQEPPAVAEPPPAEPTPPPPVVVAPEPEPAPAVEDEAPRGPFSKGSKRLTLLLGTGFTANETYFILGAGIGVFLADGLEVGLDYEAWLFGEPVMHRVSPETRYVFHMVPTIKPYIGVFYRHTFVNDYTDLNYLGGRAGIYIVPKRSRMFIGGGAVYEKLLDCEDTFVDCDNVYPEITFGVSL